MVGTWQMLVMISNMSEAYLTGPDLPVELFEVLQIFCVVWVRSTCTRAGYHKAMLDGIKPNGLNQMATHDFNFLCNVQERLTREDQEQFSLITLHQMILILLSSRY